MTYSFLPPSVDSALNDHARRIYDLEQRLIESGAGGISDLVFYFDGPILISNSGIRRPPSAVTVNRLLLTLIISGTTQTTVQLLKNGIAVGSATILANQRATTVFISPVGFLSETDEMQMRIIEAGVGAAELTAEAGT